MNETPTIYDIYLRSMAELKLPAMTAAEFKRAELEVDFVFSSIIDKDAFEAAFGW